MIPIGEFAKLSGVTIKALHHYDAMGLLKPAYVDPANGFRFYNSHQLAVINQIIVLKASSFSLQEIKSHLDNKVSTKALTTLMLNKLNLLETEINQQQLQAQHLRKQIFRMQNGGLAMNHAVVVKNVEPILVATIRKVVRDYKEMAPMWEALNNVIENEGIKKAIPCMTLYHNGWDTAENIDISVVEPLTKSFVPSQAQNASTTAYEIDVVELPGVTRMASIVHQGPFDSITQTYQTIEQWLLDHNEQLNGSVREIYHEGEWSTDDPNQYITEIQFPLT